MSVLEDALNDYSETALKLAQLRSAAAEEFVRLAALAGPKANTFLIQKQVDAEYIEKITKTEALLEIQRVLMEVAARDANEPA